MLAEKLRKLSLSFRKKLQSPQGPIVALLLSFVIFLIIILVGNSNHFQGGLSPYSVAIASSLAAILFWISQRSFTVTTTEEKRPNASRVNSLTLRNAIYQQAIVAFTDVAGRILEVNENFCRISQYQKEELIGQTHSLLKSDYHSKAFYANLYKTIHAGQPWKGIFCNKAKDGSLYWVDSIIYPQFSSSGEIEGFLAIRHNITEQVNLLDSSAMVQKRMETLLEYLPLGVIELDPDCNIKQLNPTFAKILGYSHASLLGKNVLAITHPDDREMAKDIQAILNSRTEMKPQERRKRYLHKDGTPVWARVTINRLANGNYITAVENIQKLVEQEAEIKRSSDQLEKLYALSTDIIGITNFDGKLLFANEAYQHITGYTIDELKKMTAHEKFHPQDLERYEENFAKVRSGQTVSWECRFRARSGEFKIIHWSSVPNVQEKIFYSIGRDITQTRESELRIMNASKMASLSQVASGVAHEINNPLAIIRGRVEIIKRQIDKPKPDIEKIQRSLNNTDEMVTRIASIIESLRIFSSPAGSSDYYEDLWIQPLIERTLGLFLERLKKRNIQYSINVINGDFHFLGRGKELSHALSMLLANSIEAIEESSEEPWIKLIAANLEDRLVIRVQDSGTGIPHELQTKIMDPFFSTKPQSMGLGLSVASGLIAGHGGSLKYDMTETHTTFIITIPHPDQNGLMELNRKVS